MVDLIMPTHNRLEFVKAALTNLAWNTPCHVASATVYDDASTDGTQDWLEENALRLGFGIERHEKGSVIHCIRRAVGTGSAPYIAKVDSDTIVPPGWLGHCLQIMQRHPDIDLLGIESMYRVRRDGEACGVERATHIGGIGVFRRSVFERVGLPEIQQKPFFGFTEWQHSNNIRSAWLNPSLPVFLLDHLPLEPWASLSLQYEELGWQRHTWGKYSEKQADLWSWWER